MRKQRLYCVGKICKPYKYWKKLFPDLVSRTVFADRIDKKGMSVIEALTWKKGPPVVPDEKYGYLTVLRLTDPYIDPKSSEKIPQCICLCDCGVTITARVKDLKSKNTSSCGCKRGNVTHQLSKHRLYSIWVTMNYRCNNINSNGYQEYGAKGVYVCPEWHSDNVKGLSNFIRDMNPTYKQGCELDKDIRAIPGKPKCYSKDTCCWVTPEINKRASNIIKLTKVQVKEIKHRLSTGLELQKDIAKDYGVTPNAISAIHNKTRWKDI